MHFNTIIKGVCGGYVSLYKENEKRLYGNGKKGVAHG